MTLAEYLLMHQATPFAWGAHDCVLFSFGWMAIRGGKNYLGGLPAWNNKAEALRVIAKVGGLEEEVSRRLKRIHPNLACDGDVSMHKGILGLFSGAHIVMASLDRGLVFINRLEAECAWSLP